MFIYNFKFDKRKIKKYTIILGFILASIIIIFLCYRAFKNTYIFKVDDEINSKDVNEITSENYTNVLKSVHDDLETYTGQKVKITGFIYRVFDFNSNQFVIARNMIISSDFQAVVVGFLCESNEACNYSDGQWIEIEGEIIKGNYHGEVPVIKVNKIIPVNIPEDMYVYPPDENYIPTAVIY